ncbi:hypothetical protein ASD71_15310 [Achromobacter sp. Root565]|nr:hypothetical protein ASD71_15310 [Achromobacter sp. Root565]
MPDKEVRVGRHIIAACSIPREQNICTAGAQNSLTIRVHLKKILLLVHTTQLILIVSTRSILFFVLSVIKELLRLLPLQSVLCVKMQPMSD